MLFSVFVAVGPLPSRFASAAVSARQPRDEHAPSESEGRRQLGGPGGNAMSKKLVSFVFVVLAVGCGQSGARPAREALACGTHADCPALEACEVEDAGSVCRAHGDAAGSGVACALDTDCPRGEECEVEGAVGLCRYHGGDAGGTGVACAAHADCPASEECEVEHGGAYCRPHSGGDRSRGGSAAFCALDSDCPAGEECEAEHGGAYCRPHGSSTDDGSSDDSSSDDGSSDDSSSDDSGSDDSGSDDSGPATGLCATDADCAAGEECEIEHGMGSCRPHGV
jgi:hypothetical protein